ncbi:MAG: hypothetical protein ABSF71_28065 [Terriglobia bacterium]|jgi:hypothetical protein
MALRIILPDYLDKNSETYLFAALQDFGAEHIAGNEWRFSQIPLSCQKFLIELKVFLPKTEQGLADRLKVTIFHS